jgi:hypothetical protein
MTFPSVDVKTAFLQGDLEEDIYMQQPPGCCFNDGLVCQLRKPIFGLKQSSRQWHVKLKAMLLNEGFQYSLADPCLFVRTGAGDLVSVLVYVDDMLISCKSLVRLEKIKRRLLDRFDARDLGEAVAS